MPPDRRPLRRHEIKEWFAKRELDKETLKNILTQHYLSAASGAEVPSSAVSGAQPSGASGSGGLAPAASAVSGAGGPEGMAGGVSAFGGARTNVISGIDLERSSKNEYFIERGAPTDRQMIKHVWGGRSRTPRGSSRVAPCPTRPTAVMLLYGTYLLKPLQHGVRNDGYGR